MQTSGIKHRLHPIRGRCSVLEVDHLRGNVPGSFRLVSTPCTSTTRSFRSSDAQERQIGQAKERGAAAQRQ
ncbi:hypothetical protein TYRP_003795 [Tyrophagus putrescentiae]|nr:hypothetical protein TYRP_003795 [Tyrophagus putrescentiae]